MEHKHRLDYLVFGKGGMLATSLEQAIAARHNQPRALFLSKTEVDITNPPRVAMAISTFRPKSVINLAAYTDVDGAESNRETAFHVNAKALLHLAKLCRRMQIRLIHLSTDYVFGNHSASNEQNPFPPSEGWTEKDPTGPMNAYGASKLAGEEIIRRSGCEHLIMRSSWLFASQGRNFVRTIAQKLLEGEPMRVVNDQIGRPTCADDLANTILDLAEKNTSGTIHACNAGPAVSWFALAGCVRDTLQITEPKITRPKITACATNEYTAKAVRPAFSALNCNRLFTNFPDCALARNDWRKSVTRITQSIHPPLPRAEIKTQVVEKIPRKSAVPEST